MDTEKIEKNREIQAKQKNNLRNPGQFRVGESGNPAGRPRGSVNKSTIASQKILNAKSKAITLKAIELALSGSIPAIRLCLERILPILQGRPLAIELPQVEDVRNLPKLTAALLNAVGSGDLEPQSALALASLIENHGKALERTELELRIAKLEEKENERLKEKGW